MTIATDALHGLKVLELGQLIAGPFAGKTLADFGADVIKIEPIDGGDPLRKWRLLREGTSVWWEVQSRNKRSVALDLKTPEGQAAVRALAAEADVLVENFKPGTMEGWGLGWDALHALNPKLIMLRISGYGQTGPYAGKPGFGVLGEAMGGLRHLTAEPGRVPVRVGVSIGDSLAALHGVIGVLLALRHREVNGGQGQMIDVALYESVFNVMESLLPEYDAFGAVRGAAGSALPGIAPSNAYACAGGAYVLVAGNGDSIFRRLMQAIGRDDLAADPGLARNDGRVQRVAEDRRRHRFVDGAATDRRGDPRAGWRWRAGGSHLQRGRHRHRRAVRGARDDRADAGRGRPAVEGAGHRAQAGGHAGRGCARRHRAWASTPTACWVPAAGPTPRSRPTTRWHDDRRPAHRRARGGPTRRAAERSRLRAHRRQGGLDRPAVDAGLRQDRGDLVHVGPPPSRRCVMPKR